MSGLPVNWESAKIGELCQLINGRAFKPTDWTTSGLPIIRIQNLNRPDANFNFYDGPVESRFLVEHGDLLFAWSGTPGTSFGAHIWRGSKAILNQHIFNVRFDRHSLNTDFLRQAINQTLDEQIAKAHGGAGLAHVTKGRFEDTTLPVPPLPEQRRIVAKIDSLSTKSSRARENLDHIPRLVEKYKQAVLAAAFRGDLTGEWRKQHGRNFSWALTNLGSLLANIRYGTAKKCSYEGGATPVLRIPNVQLGRIDPEDMKFADFDPGEIKKLRLAAGDILVIRSNGSLDLVGRSAVIREAQAGMLFAGYLIRLRPRQDVVDPDFLHLFLMAPDTRADIENLAKSTSGVNNINSAQLQGLRLAHPERDEQNEIVRRVVHAFNWIDRLAHEAASARKLVDRLDQAVLAKAFRGELVAQDSSDEPASALLARIAGQKPPATEKKKRAAQAG